MSWQKTFFSTVFVGGAFGSAFLYYASKIEPEKLQITYPKLPQPFPVKTVFFSDLHLGKHYSPSHLSTIVDTINQQNPQLVLFGGDFFAKLPRDICILDFDWLQQQLSRIQAPLGKFAVLGNHDVRYHSKPFFYSLFEKSGFTVLWDSITEISPKIKICGLSPYSNGEILRELPQDGFHICLCHMPDKARYLSLQNCNIMLSGHSHNGQIRLPILTKQILPPGGKMYPYGIYRPQNNCDCTLFVSRGIGTSGPAMRFASCPELVVFS